jgi:cell division protein FtsX
MHQQVLKIIFAVLIGTLSILGAVVLAVTFALLVGLFHREVDNKEVLAIIGPAFQGIIAAIVGMMGALIGWITRDVAGRLSAAPPSASDQLRGEL